MKCFFSFYKSFFSIINKLLIFILENLDFCNIHDHIVAFFDIEIMINDQVDEFIEELFSSLKNRTQSNLVSIKGSNFVFDCVNLLC